MVAIQGTALRSLVEAGLVAIREDKIWGEVELEGWGNLLLQQKKWMVQFNLDTVTSHTRQKIITNILEQGIETLKSFNQVYGQILELYYFNKQSDQQILQNKQLAKSRTTLLRKRHDAINKLTNTILKKENASRKTWSHEMLSLMPTPDYIEFVGRSEDTSVLFTCLSKNEAPWLVNLVGLGGIGKTAITHKLTNQLLEKSFFLKMIWIHMETSISASTHLTEKHLEKYIINKLLKSLGLDNFMGFSNEKKYSHIQNILTHIPHLIIIDGLDITFDVSKLLKRLATFANPSKFLLVGRFKLKHQPQLVYTYQLKPLTNQESNQLITSLFQQTGIRGIHNANKKTKKRIISFLGGNPLAMQLITQLAENWVAEELLNEFGHSSIEPIKKLYDQIFKSIFRQLTNNDIFVLQAFLFASDDGLDRKHLDDITNLGSYELNRSIERLSRFSLVYKSSPFKFSIDRLTYAFVKQQNSDLDK